MSNELLTKLQVISQGTSGGSEPVAAVGDEGLPESMQCSAECSPAPTPQRSGGPCLTPCSGSKAPGALLPSALKARLPQHKALQLNEQMPTSPSDPQLEGIDLRKVGCGSQEERTKGPAVGCSRVQGHASCGPSGTCKREADASASPGAPLRLALRQDC
jgi:hypothetical protein